LPRQFREYQAFLELPRHFRKCLIPSIPCNIYDAAMYTADWYIWLDTWISVNLNTFFESLLTTFEVLYEAAGEVAKNWLKNNIRVSDLAKLIQISDKIFRSNLSTRFEEIRVRGQFHQHFTLVFFVRKSLRSFFLLTL